MKVEVNKINERESIFVQEKADCRLYRLMVMVPGQDMRTYPIRAKSKQAARVEAKAFVVSMIQTYKDDRIAWKMTNDKCWNFGTHEAEKVSAAVRVTKIVEKAKLAFNNYFFVGTDLKDVFKQQ